MNIEHLRYAIEVARAGSISQAAENLYIGQPNLSKAIKELEHGLGVSLFKRTSRGVELTDKGQAFVRHAKSILQQVESLEALSRADEGGALSLRVSAPRASYIADAFTRFLSTLDTERPLLMDFLETHALRAIRHVADGRSDLGVIRFRSEYRNYFSSVLAQDDLDSRQLFSTAYRLLLSRAHPLAEAEALSVEALWPYIELIHGDTVIPLPRGVAETERGQTPGERKVQLYERGSQFDILSRVPGTYMWTSPMPKDILRRNGLVQRTCAQAPVFCDWLIYRGGHVFRPLEEAFLGVLEGVVNEIRDEEAP